MFRYLVYLIADLAMEVIAIPAAFVLPFFANKEGWLPRWLWWFQTPDNSLNGDQGWQTQHWQWRYKLPKPLCTYVGQMGWLLRNRAYGFKWTVISAPVVQKALGYRGDITIKNRDHAKAGVVHCWMNQYWQYKRITRIGQSQKCIMLNFGWQLDNYITDPTLYLTQPRALFMFSPRICAFHPD